MYKTSFKRKTTSLKKKLKVFFINSFIFVSIVALIYIVYNYNIPSNKELGVKAVKLMYDFQSSQELDNNMVELKKITNKVIFNRLTIDNEERTLLTYLKFKGESCTVSIIENTDTYVLYSLDTTNIGNKRVFLFTFDVGIDGKINYVREMECIDFVESSN